MKKVIPYLLFIGFIVIFDQVTKYLVVENMRLYERLPIIDGFLNFTFAKNTGAAFSFGDSYSDTVRLIIFKVLPVGVCIWIFKMLFESVRAREKFLAVAYSLILGGAIGNLIDRIRLDYVVDFISVYHRGIDVFGIRLDEWYFAIFNIADSAVSIAGAMLVLDFILRKKQPKNDELISEHSGS